jgi:hypothetical protein
VVTVAKIMRSEFEKFARDRITQGLSGQAHFFASMKQISDFANEHELDDEAEALFDELVKSFAEILEDGIGKAPDSFNKRRMVRLLAQSKGKHHSAEMLLEGLGKPLSRKLEIVEAARPIFLTSLQSVLDVLFDSTRQSQHGPAQFATVSMLYWAVDELTAAFYLAERTYATQAYNHIRTVYDLLEKVELFFKQPKWAEIWGSNDKKKILKELSPGAVRLKLGRPKFDVFYSVLSEIGSHGTFEAVRRRVASRENQTNRRQVGIWIGGVPWESEIFISVSCCIFAVTSTLIMAAMAFQERLHGEEALDVLKTRSNEAIKFLECYFVDPMRASGIDASELIAVLKKATQFVS